MMYEKGWGVPQNTSEIVKRHRKTAEQGLAVAQYRPASMYHEGHGLPRDDAEAVRWFCAAANQHYPPAQYDLGIMYQDGSGVAQDSAQAHMCFSLARHPAGSGRRRPAAELWQFGGL